MSKICETIAYIKGLAEGLQLDDSTKEGKVLLAVIEALDDLAIASDMHDETIGDLIDGIGSINEDLSDLEDFVFDDDNIGGRGDDDDDGEIDELDDEEFVDDFIELECPDCGDTVYFDPEMIEMDENPICPNCGGVIELA